MIVAETILNRTLNLPQIIGVISFVLSLYFAIHLHLQKKRKSNQFLSIFFLMFFVIQLVILLADLKFNNLATLLIGFFIGARLSLAPLIYVYLMQLTKTGDYSSRQIAKHFILPVSLTVTETALIIAGYYLPEDSNIRFVIVKVALYIVLLSHYAVFLALNIYYIAKCYSVIKHHQKRISNIFSYEEGVSLKWAKILLWGYVIFTVAISLSDIDSENFPEWIYNSFVIIFVAFTGFHGIQQSEIFTSNIESVHLEPAIKSEEKQEDASENMQSDENKFSEIYMRICKLIENEKLFLKSDLTVSDITRKLRVNGKYISLSINKETQLNFVSFINQYRVNHAKEMLADKDFSHFTIEAIGQNSGFKSKSAFYNAFKKITSLTPSEYKEKFIR